jgi:hypothetical protein
MNSNTQGLGHNGKNLRDNEYSLIDTFPRDIPTGRTGLYPTYYLNKGYVETKMSLITLENGFDSIQIRIWYSYSFKDSSQLFILKYTNNSWNAELINFIYNLDPSGKTIESINKSSKVGVPKSGWKSFINKALKLGIIDLPDKTKIINYPEVVHGDDVIVEISTKTIYRIYSYKEPRLFQGKIKEAKRMEDILVLIEKEFNFNRLRRM